ncbi:MAG: glycosyltransferase [Ilumatobacteraceae bacterium]|nr:glycosyltransferase [Ilumatobacteraceae bacterium]
MTSSLPSARVAVIMRTFERPVLLARAIASVQQQTFADWVLIIVNNGGDPRAVDAIVKVASGSLGRESTQIMLKHFDTCVNAGVASNAAMGMCASDYVVMHDDTETWHPDFLKATVGVLDQNRSMAAAATSCTRVLETQRANRLWPIHESLEVIDDGQLTLTSLIAGHILPAGSVLIRRSAALELGGFDESLPALDHWEFLVRVAEHSSIMAVPENLTRHHSRSIRSDDEAENPKAVVVRTDTSAQDLIVDRWLKVTMPNGLNKGELALTAASARQAAESVRAMDDWSRRVQGLEREVRDLQLAISADIANQNIANEHIAHQMVYIMQQRRLWRRISRVILNPAHGLRAIKRRVVG